MKTKSSLALFSKSLWWWVFYRIAPVLFSLPALSAPKVEVLLFDGGPAHPHHRRVKKILEDETSRRCNRQVLIRDFSLFDKKGNFDLPSVQKNLTSAKNERRVQILHLSWNDKLEPKFQRWVDQVREVLQAGMWVVAAAGENIDAPENILRLSETVMGKAIGKHDMGFLIGELTDKGHLAPRSHYGPELLTALRPPSGDSGSSFSAPLFTARLGCALASDRNQTHRPQLWKRKDSSLKNYPTLDDLFN